MLVKNITDTGDTELNGRTGRLCAKHFINVAKNPHTVQGDIGVILDGDDEMKFANLRYGEFEEIKNAKR